MSVRELPQWMRRKERGNLFWLRVMSLLSMGLGRRLSRVVVLGIALYFLIAATAARRASAAYLTRCLGRRPGWLDLYRHMFTFASTVHDRVYLLNDREAAFDVRCVGPIPGGIGQAGAGGDTGETGGQDEPGGFLFGAHLGSFEVLRAAARWDARDKVCVAMYPENARLINQALSAINPQAVSNIIALGKIDSILHIHEKLKGGGLVGILADRASGADQYVQLPFLGQMASFPVGPFRLAAMMGRPVYFMAGLYRGGNRYDVHFELLSDGLSTGSGDGAAGEGQGAQHGERARQAGSRRARQDRDALMRELMARYVATLERHCREAPFNWFNFYDFWGDPHHGSH